MTSLDNRDMPANTDPMPIWRSPPMGDNVARLLISSCMTNTADGISHTKLGLCYICNSRGDSRVISAWKCLKNFSFGSAICSEVKPFVELGGLGEKGMKKVGEAMVRVFSQFLMCKGASSKDGFVQGN